MRKLAILVASGHGKVVANRRCKQVEMVTRLKNDRGDGSNSVPCCGLPKVAH